MPQRARYGRGTSFGMRVEFIELYTICLFICTLGVKFTVIQLSKQKSYSNKRKEKDRRFPLEIVTFLFLGDHTIHHLTIHHHTTHRRTAPYTTSLAPLSYSTASVSLPIPLSVANRFSRSTISVSNGSPK
jgi:hypothetical protein